MVAVKTKETTACQVRLRQALTWGHASIGEVLHELAASACFFCRLLLLLLQVLLFHVGTNTGCSVLEPMAAEITLSQTGE